MKISSNCINIPQSVILKHLFLRVNIRLSEIEKKIEKEKFHSQINFGNADLNKKIDV